MQHVERVADDAPGDRPSRGAPGKWWARPRARVVAPALLGAVLAALFVGSVVFVGGALPSKRPLVPDASAQRARVLDAELSYHASGDGTPTIVLLHGFGGDGSNWAGVMPHLRCGRAIALDQVGFGASSRPDVDYSLSTHARHVVGLLDALGVQRAVLVGTSMGASVAAFTAAQAPERIAGVVMMAPSGLPGTLTYPWPRSILYRPGWPNRVALAIARTPVYRWRYPNSLARQALGVTGSYDASFAQALGRIGQPALLIWARTDERVPFASAARYRERIPQLAFREGPAHAGHTINGKAPEWTAAAICDFVTQHRFQ